MNESGVFFVGMNVQKDSTNFAVLTETSFSPVLQVRKPTTRKIRREEKTDRRDSIRLAQLLKLGLDTPVHILSEQDEAVRELLRYRDEVRRKAG
jgi:hypothetical protein